MADKRVTRTDLPKREFDSDLNDPTFSNQDDPPVDQRDSDYRADHKGKKGDSKRGPDDQKNSGNQHDIGNADELSR